MTGQTQHCSQACIQSWEVYASGSTTFGGEKDVGCTLRIMVQSVSIVPLVEVVLQLIRGSTIFLNQTFGQVCQGVGYE